MTEAIVEEKAVEEKELSVKERFQAAASKRVTSPKQETTAEEKPYQFKKQENGKYKVFQTGTDVLLEGFEDKEWASPLEGMWYFKKLMKEVEPELAEESKLGQGRGKITEIPVEEPIEVKPTEEGVPFKIPIIEGRGPIIEILNGKEKYFEVVIREHDEPNMKSEPISDGVTTTYYVAMGKKVILPESVINTAREAIYSIISTHQDEKTLRCTNLAKETPRFSVEIGKEIAENEAIKWLREQRKTNISIF